MNNKDKKVFAWCIFASCLFLLAPTIYLILHGCGVA